MHSVTLNYRRFAALSVACMATASSVSAAKFPGTERLAFDVTEGPNLNSFLRVGPVAAHVLLRSGTEPRILVAFPAGDSGVGVWFSPTRAPVTWNLDERPRPLARHDEKGRPLFGIALHASANAPELVLKQALLSSVRVLRDYQTYGTVPPEVEVVANQRQRKISWKRNRLDGAAGYRLSLEVTHGDLKDGHIVAGRDGKIGLRMTALSGEAPLTPLNADGLLDDPSHVERSARNVLTFLSYEEKFLAGSWRYDTYFGRDTLMSLRLLLPALSSQAVEDGLGSVLARLSSTGEVAHEEEIGEFAILDHLRTNGSRSDAPIFDYKMIDGSFMLAPVVQAWLLDQPRASPRAAAFLARKVARQGAAPRTIGADLVSNLRFVLRSAQAFADHPRAQNLISLKTGFVWGQWRDSDDGIAHGRYPYDVNAVFVPAALEAASRLYVSGLLEPYLSADDRAALSPAADMAAIWRAKAGAFFDVDIDNAAARRQIDAYTRSVGVPSDDALRAVGQSAVHFPALALDATANPIPILHSDQGFQLLFGNPGVPLLETAIDTAMRPFPSGLMTDVGMVVANPVFASPELQARFGNDAYHGTVIWSWQQAVFAAGLSRQLERQDLPPYLEEKLISAQKRLWQAIEAGRSVINSELWSWSYRDGHYAIAPFGIGLSDSDESNAAQLWSTVYIAIHPPLQ